MNTIIECIIMIAQLIYEGIKIGYKFIIENPEAVAIIISIAIIEILPQKILHNMK